MGFAHFAAIIIQIIIIRGLFPELTYLNDLRSVEINDCSSFILVLLLISLEELW